MVGIDAAESPVEARHPEFVLESMLGQGRVVGFNVQFEVAKQAILTEEIAASRRVKIILVFRGFLGFGFQKIIALEANLSAIIPRHAQEAGHIV